MTEDIVTSSTPITRKTELNISEINDLVSSKDYRSFVKTYLKMKNLNFSDFSRAAQCTRAFTNQVLSNKRRLTAKSVYMFEQAFKLPLNAKKVFRLLVAKEESDLFPEMDRSKVDDQIKKLQMTIEAKSRKDFTEEEYKLIDQKMEINHQAVSIFAACGDYNTGSSLEQLYQRTRLAENILIKNLDLLVKMNFLEKKDDLYFPVDMHVHLKTRMQSELFHKFIESALQSANSRLSQVTENSPEFFFSSQFCINESLLPVLKRELNETILKFVEDSVVSNGDRVVKVVTALHL